MGYPGVHSVRVDVILLDEFLETEMKASPWKCSFACSLFHWTGKPLGLFYFQTSKFIYSLIYSNEVFFSLRTLKPLLSVREWLWSETCFGSL